MTVEDADQFVLFQDVRIIRATAPALLCGIGDKRVWLPRGHISGKLWCTGDRGKLFVRRWVAHERRLIDPVAPVAVSPAGQSITRRRLRDRLHAVRRDPRLASSRGAGRVGDDPTRGLLASLFPTEAGDTGRPEEVVRPRTSRSPVTALVDVRRSRRTPLVTTPDADRPA
jgi:hypothetical protein